MTSNVPFDIVDVETELNKQLLEDFHGERTGFLQVGPHKYFLPSKYRGQAADYYNFKLRPEDVWICTFPRSGTTVMQEMLWLIVKDLDYEGAAATSLIQRFPFIEFSILVDDGLMSEVMDLVRGDPEMEEVVRNFGISRIPTLEATPSPRFIKSHLPPSLLPPALLNTCKMVYMARNPKDVVTSYYHHNRLLKTQGYVGDFPKYCEYFEKDLLPWTPYWEHIREGWESRHNPNMLFLFYEDMIKDMPATIHRVAEFFGKTMSTEQVQKLAAHLHIDNFRKNPSTNLDAENLPGIRVPGEQNFIRKGKNGSWKAEFTPELTSRADEWIEKNIALIPDLKFPDN